MNHIPHSNVTHFTDIGVLTSTPTLRYWHLSN